MKSSSPTGGGAPSPLVGSARRPVIPPSMISRNDRARDDNSRFATKRCAASHMVIFSNRATALISSIVRCPIPRGGVLTIEWTGGSVMMTGPATKVFEGEIEL